MRKLVAMARKEFRQTSRDPLSLVMLLLLPSMMVLLFGYALNFDVRHVDLAVQDHDRTASSRSLVSAFVASEYFDRVESVAPGTDAGAALREGRARAVLVLPQGYGRDLARGGTPSVQLLLDGTDSNSAATILSYARGVVARENAALLLRAAELGPAGAGRAAAAAIDARPRIWYNPSLESAQFLVPGLVGFILMLTAVLSTALSVVREKERGTMEQLRITPLRPWQLLLGKTAPYLVISLAATAVILVAARVLFGVVVKGPYLHLLAATLLYLFGALGLGLLISSFARTQAMAYQVGALTSILPALYFSDFIFPIRSMPEPLQWLSYAVPARYYLTILRGIIVKGAGLAPFWQPMLFLAIYAAVVLGIAWVRLRREETV